MPERTIGISLGTRTIGIAVFSGTTLIDWQVKSYKGKISNTKQYMISGSLLKLLRSHNCSQIALKVPHNSSRHPSVHNLIKHLLKTLNERNFDPQLYSLNQLKQALADETTNKKGIARWAFQTYPTQLRLVHQKQSAKSNGYYLKLFEAVAVGHAHIHRR